MDAKVILFDLDGTLTDPAEGICRSVVYALEKENLPVQPMESYHRYIGPPLLWSFAEYDHASPEQAKRLMEHYRVRYDECGKFENKVYPGIPELLRDLKAAGKRVGVATGKPTYFSRQILDHFGLAPYLDVISGIPMSNEPLNKQQVISYAMEKLGAADGRGCVMIGDRRHDGEGARLCAIPFIGVLYGYGSRDELEKEHPSALAATVAELRELLL